MESLLLCSTPNPTHLLLTEKLTTTTIIISQSTTPATTTTSSKQQPIFSISSLPRELRQQIYTSYFRSLPPVEITSENASLPFHNISSLASSSPFFPYDTPSYFYYQNTTFTFSSGDDMKIFSTLNERSKHVRKIQIEDGKEEGRDWVYLMNECFKSLEEVEFIRCSGGEKKGLCARCQGRQFEKWWEGVKDAVREGICGKNGLFMLKVKEGDGCERVVMM